jgi:hypothetical protein
MKNVRTGDGQVVRRRPFGSSLEFAAHALIGCFEPRPWYPVDPVNPVRRGFLLDRINRITAGNNALAKLDWLLLLPRAEILQSVFHIILVQGMVELHQSAKDYPNRKLIGKNDSSMRSPYVHPLVMEKREVTFIVRKNRSPYFCGIS